MIIYLCERLVRFIRYMQTVRYQKVRLAHISPAASRVVPHVIPTHTLSFSDCDATLQSAGAAAGEERLQNGGGSVRLHQLPSHLAAGVAPVHHDLRARGGLLQHPHPLGRRLDRQAHRHHAEATRGSRGTQVSQQSDLTNKNLCSSFIYLRENMAIGKKFLSGLPSDWVWMDLSGQPARMCSTMRSAC